MRFGQLYLRQVTKDVDKAVKAAQKAFENSWANLHPRDRAKYLRLSSRSITEREC